MIHLEVGQPDFDTPDHIVEAACRGAREGHTRYVPNAGIDDLRAAAARYIERGTGVATAPEQILVTQGAVLSAASAFLALLEPDDEVLLPDPGWPNYAMAVSLFHGRPLYYDLRPERCFLPDIEGNGVPGIGPHQAAASVQPVQSHRTGTRRGPDRAADGVRAAARPVDSVRRDLREIVFDGSHASALPHDVDERLILVTGMSKSFAMTGFRVGFTRARAEYVELATKLQEPLVSCGVGFAQKAAVAALEGPGDCVRAMCDQYRARRDLALEILREYGLYRYTPGGAFYLLVDISSHWPRFALVRAAADLRAQGRGGTGVHLRQHVRRPRAHLHRLTGRGGRRRTAPDLPLHPRAEPPVGARE